MKRCFQPILFSIILCVVSEITNAQYTLIPIETAGNALVLGVNKDKDLSILYYGKKLANTAEYELTSQVYRQTGDYTQVLDAAYSSSGSRNLVEPAITVTHADGNNSLDLRYVSHQTISLQSFSQTSVLLRDPVYGL